MQRLHLSMLVKGGPGINVLKLSHRYAPTYISLTGALPCLSHSWYLTKSLGQKFALWIAPMVEFARVLHQPDIDKVIVDSS